MSSVWPNRIDSTGVTGHGVGGVPDKVRRPHIELESKLYMRQPHPYAYSKEILP